MSPELDVAPRLEVPVQLDAHDVDGYRTVARALRCLAAPTGARQHDDESDQGDRSRGEYAVRTNPHSTPVILRLPTELLLYLHERKSRRRLLGEATCQKCTAVSRLRLGRFANASAGY
jgi:hypothetical protein